MLFFWTWIRENIVIFAVIACTIYSIVYTFAYNAVVSM